MYALSEAFEERIENAYTETKIFPTWIADSNNFWYRKKTLSTKSCFMFVNPEHGISRPAFDHARLAKALSDRGIEAEAHSLPFTWIDPSNESEGYVRFRVGAKKFQFSKDCRLSEYDGDINEEILEPLSQERASKLATAETSMESIGFVNLTARPIVVAWIGFEGELIEYPDIEAGGSLRRVGSTGQVWRVTDAETKMMIGSFAGGESESVVIIEEDMKIITKPMDSCKDDESSKKHDFDDNFSSEQPKTFVKDYNVWCRQADRKETQLSTNGTKDNVFDGSKIYESHNTSFAVVYQYTPGQGHLIYQVESSPKDRLEPRLQQFDYPRGSDKIRYDRPRMFDLTSMKEIEFSNAQFQDPLAIDHIGWSLDGKEYRFSYRQRGHQIARVVGIDTQGNVRCILEEKSNTFLYNYPGNDYQEIRGTEELIWGSERDGWSHLYLFDLKLGNLKNRVTQGDWVVNRVDRIEEEKRRLWITVSGVIEGQDPYYKHLARVNLDGSDFTILTKGEGTHTWKWTQNHTYLIDTWSRVDMPPQTALLNDENGQHILQLKESPNLYLLYSIGWAPPIRFSSPGRDGTTMIHGIIIIPPDLDPSNKYPILEEV